MNQYPKVSIIILNWNGYLDTIECMESLKKITYPNYEIIVVDNASSGEDVKILKEKYADSIHIIDNDQNYGFPEGCNIGMRYALQGGTDYLLLLNNDVKVDPEFLSKLVEVAESDPAIGITGSKIYYYYQPNRIQGAGGKIIWWLGIMYIYGDEEDTGQWDKIAERDYLFGTSFLLKKAVVEKIGFMDPFFVFGVEEYDYCTRAKRDGFKIVYVPESRVWHKVGASQAKLQDHPGTHKMLKKSWGTGMYKYYYRLYKKYCPPVLFLFPFFCSVVLRLHWIPNTFRFIRQGNWQELKLRTIKQWKLLFG